MRRPRAKLQVSTFPFLAVLLCAMGALLLLLYIMDRRAKIAARYRVAEELQARQQRTQAEEEARKAEWEHARSQLHLSLVSRQHEVLDKSKGVQVSLIELSKKIDAANIRQGDVQQQLKDEAGKVAVLQFEIDSQRLGLKQADKMEAAAKAELVEAVKELADLERAFQQLKKMKDGEKQTYSVVPYRGKRGDDRTPIYVECVRDGVLFHPGKNALHALDFTAGGVRAEVERRHGALAIQKSAKDDVAGPYVLFLIRPDGIGSYYKAMSALKGYQLDFGYELVDAGWALDFSGDAYAKNVRPVQKQQPKRADDGPMLTFPSIPPGTNTPGAPGLTKSDVPLLPPPPVGIAGGGAGNGGGGGGSAVPPTPLIGNPRVDTGIPSKPPSFVPIGRNAPPVPIASAGNSNSSGVNPIAVPIPGNSVATPPSVEVKQGTAGGPSEKPVGPALPGIGLEPSKKPQQTPPLSRLLGNKDFIITIECRGDAVTVLPGGFVYRWTGSNLDETDKALAETIKNLIARRQASVRAGEPPYRPIIRFQVSPNGLRTYYHAYPLLESLRVPMTRENVEE